MKQMRAKSVGWIVALFGGVCLAVVAVGMAQRQPAFHVPVAEDARALSALFRKVSRDALPSIVSIETLGKTKRQTGRSFSPFEDENSPFREFFRSDPRFREFFEQMPDREMFRTRGMGSGFIIDPSGIIMTNSHVVRDADEVKVRLHDGREFVATDIKADPRSDVAIIRIEGPATLRALPLGDSDGMQVGDWVLAVGSPFGLDMSVTAGIISAKGRGPGIAEREDFLQTDAAINPGNSGGPLLNLNGEVIGINTAISTRSGGYDGVGFAIPVNMAKWVSEQLVEHGAVKRAYLGVSIQPIDSALSKQFKTEVGEGALVAQIVPNSPADNAKIQQGDVILEIAGQKVTGPRNLQGLVEQLEVDKSYRMLILRNGKRTTVRITLSDMPQAYSMSRVQPVNEKSNFSSSADIEELGLEIKELTPQIAEKLGFEDVKGVLISSVKTNSAADLAGLRAGQVIQKVGTHEVSSSADVREAMTSDARGDGVLLLVRSQRGTQFVVVPLNR